MMTLIRRKGCDPCCTDWKAKINELWEKYSNVVRGVKFGSQDISYPDGDGIIEVDTEGLITVDEELSTNSTNPVENRAVATAINNLETVDDGLNDMISQNATDIDDLEDSMWNVKGDIDTLKNNLNTMGATVGAMQSYNLETRGIAAAAKETADAMDGRMDSAEANIQTNYDRTVANEGRIDTAENDIDALESGKVDKLTTANLNAYTHDGSTQGEVAVVNGTTAATIPVRDANGRIQAADPASGATDKSLVTANWVSQTGNDAPNNLIHKTGAETKTGRLDLYYAKILTNVPVKKGQTVTNKWREMFRVMDIGSGTSNIRATYIALADQSNRFALFQIYISSGTPHIYVFCHHLMQPAMFAVNYDEEGHAIFLMSTGYSYQPPNLIPILVQRNDTVDNITAIDYSNNTVYDSASNFPYANTIYGELTGVTIS